MRRRTGGGVCKNDLGEDGVLAGVERHATRDKHGSECESAYQTEQGSDGGQRVKEGVKIVMKNC